MLILDYSFKYGNVKRKSIAATLFLDDCDRIQADFERTHALI